MVVEGPYRVCGVTTTAYLEDFFLVQVFISSREVTRASIGRAW
jgi:hypothetical protein